jgi:excisionase family DNA binding protein
MTPDTVTAAQAAELFGVDVRTIGRWIADGTLKAGWNGRERAIPASELERLAQPSRDARQSAAIADGAAALLQRFGDAHYDRAVDALVVSAGGLLKAAKAGKLRGPQIREHVECAKQVEQVATLFAAVLELRGAAAQQRRRVDAAPAVPDLPKREPVDA